MGFEPTTPALRKRCSTIELPGLNLTRYRQIQCRPKSLTGSLGQLYATFFVIGLAGNGTTQMGYGGAVASWFTARRGLALACVLAGVGIGSTAHPLMADWLT